jgi:glycosyltransferase involved in cell wall biosynthesis
MAKVIGMVGRNAEVKDWPSFCSLALKLPQVEAWGVGVTAEEAKELGDDASYVQWKGFQPNGRELISKLDLFVLTSKHEQLPTVVLECFVNKTPICGFIPRGGMSDILSFSNGALREVFIEERDTDKLAAIVLKILNDDELRKRIVEDGWQIVTNHFDAVKNCRGQLLEIYRRFAK